MGTNKHLPMPHKDLITGESLYVSELTSEGGDVVIRGKFQLPNVAKLDPDNAHFLETFLRCRGMISSVEKEMGLSYPTVRAKLDQLLSALELKPVKDDHKTKEKLAESKRKILDQLEAGEISPEEAKRKIKEEIEA